MVKQAYVAAKYRNNSLCVGQDRPASSPANKRCRGSAVVYLFNISCYAHGELRAGYGIKGGTYLGKQRNVSTEIYCLRESIKGYKIGRR